MWKGIKIFFKKLKFLKIYLHFLLKNGLKIHAKGAFCIE